MPTTPLSRELGAMRPTLVPAILQTVANNIAHNQHDLHVFELGRAIVHADGYPEERTQIAIAMTGRRAPERFGAEKDVSIDLFDLKGVLEGWFACRRLAPGCEPAEHPSMTPGTVGAFSLGSEPVAWFGQACDELTADMRLKHPLFLAVVELDRVFAQEAAPMVYTALPQFPAVVRDISFVAPKSITNKTVVDTILSTGIEEIESVELFDIYEDKDALGEGRASLAYSITYRDPAKTLTDKKVNALHERVRQQLADALKVELR
jgi:phenylalanyl-tRNA synthetase beta chain